MFLKVWSQTYKNHLIHLRDICFYTQLVIYTQMRKTYYFHKTDLPSFAKEQTLNFYHETIFGLNAARA